MTVLVDEVEEEYEDDEPQPDTPEWFRDKLKDDMVSVANAMSPAERDRLTRLAKPRIVEPYTKHVPHPVQQVFLSLGNMKEAMYGGAAGGGKSDCLLMSALQYVDVPGYSALILRRTWPDLNAPGAILDRARNWFANTGAKQKDGGRIWEFPGPDGGPGGRIQFGYLQYDNDKFKYQSAEYQFVGFDELTQFEESTYNYMFSRVRRPTVSCLNCRSSIRQYRNTKTGAHYWKHTQREGKKCRELFADPMVIEQYGKADDGLTLFDVPLRVRSATNPGGIGHLWVKEHFIDPRTRSEDAVFLPALLRDNPSLDQESYIDNLNHLLPVDRERLLNGDWDVEEEGSMFARHEFKPVSVRPEGRRVQRVRFWDLAATLDGDYTVGALLSFNEGVWCIEDIVRIRAKPRDVEKTILQTATLDGTDVPVRMEQEPGSSGVNNISHYRRNILIGFNFDGIRSTGDKEKRAYPFASAATAGNVTMISANWNRDFLDEAALFPHGANDDQVDACTGAMGFIAFGKRARLLA